MVKNHLKRLAAPKTWNILRKTNKFITRQNPGGHSKKLSMSINTLLKDILKLTKTSKETKFVLTKQEVLVNNVRRKDNKAQVGFLDVLSLTSINKTYRISVDKKGMLKAKEISKEQAKHLILKITGKSKIKGNKLQINTLNGYNVLVSEKDGKDYKIGDTIIFDITEHKIVSHLSFAKGAHALIMTGKHSGKQGEIISVEKEILKVKTEKELFETNKNYALIINKENISELD